MKYGDKYMDVLQEGIKKVQGIENFQLANNRITSSISGRLIQSLSKNAKEVNLCKNRIGGIGIDNITSSLINKDCRIEVLDLEDN
jgi:Ran GTPase-activating protein (RanGAP) involved in mRNA processing and transport